MLDHKLKDKVFWVIALSIVGITILHYSTLMSEWEVHIFYRRLYYFPIILAAFRYRLKGGIMASIIVSIFYAPHLLLYSIGLNIASMNQYLEIILFILIGIITGRLVESGYKKQKLLEHKIIEITRLQNYTKNIVDSIKNGVISLDNDYRITSINKEGEGIFDKRIEMGHSIKDILGDKKLLDIFTQVKVQKKPLTNVKTQVQLNDNKYLELGVFPLLDIVDRVQGLVIVIEDKSREKNLEAQAIRGDRLATIGELASGIAHEIRNPMGIIKTISQVLQKETKNHDVKEGLEIIEKEIDRANRVIQSLLDFAKPLKNVIEEVSLMRTLEEVILITNKYAEKQHVAIKANLNDKHIMADKEKLKQVFINIIFNAVQAMPEGGTVHVIIEVLDDWVKISFKDNGIGIHKENVNKIFNPFFTTKEKGTGLGLSISNRMIEDHKGYMNVESELGKGTNIEIYLPLKYREDEESV